MSILEINSVSKSFGGVKANVDISMSVDKGKIVGLIGPNGSGKTTTAKMALGLYKNISGKVEKFTEKIAYVPQKISIDWTLPIRVFEFMNLTSNLKSEEINNALDITGAKHLIDNDLKSIFGAAVGAFPQMIQRLHECENGPEFR